MANPYKRLLFLFFCFTGILNITAQENTIYKIKVEALGGRTFLKDKDNYFGIEGALELPLYGNHNWEYAYNFPTIGFALGVISLDKLDYINPIIYANPYFNYPIIHTRGFSLNAKLGAGIAMMGTGDDETGYIFPFTGLLTGGVNMEIALGKRYGNPLSQWSITLEANSKVIHNGNITKNSKNIAAFDGAFGFKYTPNIYPLPIKYPAKPVTQTLALEVCGQGGVNQLSREDERYYPNVSLNVGFYLPFSNVYRLGLGADAFYNTIYDGTQRLYGNTRYNFIKEDEFSNKFRAGIFLANDLTISRYIVGLHTGIYVFSKMEVPQFSESGEENGNLTENWLYSKLVMKYKITPNFMVNAQFKSHLLKMECFEVGLGFALPEFSLLMKNPFRNISIKKEDRDEIKID